MVLRFVDNVNGILTDDLDRVKQLCLENTCSDMTLEIPRAQGAVVKPHELRE
jgi:hypothetical protein